VSPGINLLLKTLRLSCHASRLGLGILDPTLPLICLVRMLVNLKLHGTNLRLCCGASIQRLWSLELSRQTLNLLLSLSTRMSSAVKLHIKSICTCLFVSSLLKRISQLVVDSLFRGHKCLMLTISFLSQTLLFADLLLKTVNCRLQCSTLLLDLLDPRHLLIESLLLGLPDLLISKVIDFNTS
jgi:hypothetical protein